MEVLLAKSYNESLDPRGWLMSEKLDGVRAYWTGDHFETRTGKPIPAPPWFALGLPAVALDGELWIGRGRFDETVGIVRRLDAGDAWRAVRYMVFDAPDLRAPFAVRLAWLAANLGACQAGYASIVRHAPCRDRADLADYLRAIEALGGEGVMLRDPASYYEHRRSATLLKVKTFHDDDAIIIGHAPGKGRHLGRLGALVARFASGVTFEVGTGLTDAQREDPPAIGERIIVRFQALTKSGAPRFPVFAGVRAD